MLESSGVLAVPPYREEQRSLIDLVGEFWMVVRISSAMSMPVVLILFRVIPR